VSRRLIKKREDRDVKGAKVVGLKSEYINIELPHAISFNGLNEDSMRATNDEAPGNFPTNHSLLLVNT
jgi:hypothetical protein